MGLECLDSEVQRRYHKDALHFAILLADRLESPIVDDSECCPIVAGVHDTLWTRGRALYVRFTNSICRHRFITLESISICRTFSYPAQPPVWSRASRVCVHCPSSSDSDKYMIAWATARSSVWDVLKYFKYAEDAQSPAFKSVGREPPITRMSWAIPRLNEVFPAVVHRQCPPT